MNIDRLKSAYAGNRAVKVICDEMASRDRNQNETKLERMLKLGRDNGAEDLKKGEVIAGFRHLEEASCGKYIEGRHGWRSRFVWEVKSLDVAAAARGEKSIERSVVDDNADLEMIEHSFVLRPDLTISLELPDDLTETEASRLATFMAALPFKGDQGNNVQ
jgi:hypothetical protein